MPQDGQGVSVAPIHWKLQKHLFDVRVDHILVCTVCTVRANIRFPPWIGDYTHTGQNKSLLLRYYNWRMLDFNVSIRRGDNRRGSSGTTSSKYYGVDGSTQIDVTVNGGCVKVALMLISKVWSCVWWTDETATMGTCDICPQGSLSPLERKAEVSVCFFLPSPAHSIYLLLLHSFV
jgi:hypothetical protein